jgi:hypothetical protein
MRTGETPEDGIIMMVKVWQQLNRQRLLDTTADDEYRPLQKA